MTSPHADPTAHGTQFGEVIVTVDLVAGDCELHAPLPGAASSSRRRTRFHSLEEIQGAYQVQFGMSATDPMANDMANALKFAGQQLKAKQEAQYARR